ncbi:MULTISPECIES: rhodanese-related sulfurtransferase [Prochlorococcus]|uniref:oxygen-dependent tRNA uridine(34) hydroxylase TrhO n=1 Tax=Prochlorococcus TaxID=1218 RepID=UPI0005339A6E|nr:MULTISPECIES: rhodanese-related sulfurtransferase [Prochlorococcus]KGG12256.1 Rhodanese domain protein UPF0176 [Prochlorococcus sp. MIT 0601]
MIHNNSSKGVNVQLQVAAFYCFSEVDPDIAELLPLELSNIADQHQIRGTVLVGLEGINGTICGSEEAVGILLGKLHSIGLKNPLQIKFSWSDKQAFRRFKSRRKNEIVTMGIPEVSPNETVGTYVEPSQWNEFVDDPETILIDTRNEYEIGVGTFEGAVNPHTDKFRDFPEWVDNNLNSLLEENSAKRIAMFCTGGIRCEKATSFLNKRGFTEVHHLRGGILRYLEEVPQSDSRWKGECFVFDQRVSLNHHLNPGVYKLCYACGMPLSPTDCDNPIYMPGVQCLNCKDSFTDDDRARFAERQKHIDKLSKRLPGNTIWPSA